MTTETETNRGRFFVTSLLPWLVAGGMLLVYGLTLDHSPSVNNIYHLSELGGWYAPRRLFAPLNFLLTYPLRWLPLAFVGTGLKLFTAVCGALTLALLARSVALLPHDRTFEQRQRELNAASILTIPVAWLPPLFAALVCGLQMTFWEYSTNSAGDNYELTYLATDASSQMLDLLLFAYCVRSLLEYRISLKNSWLLRFAFVYGLGMADNWLMVGFFPGFLAALIWIRGLSFFTARSLGLLALGGAVGLSLIFFLPLLMAFDHIPGFGFWEAVRRIFQTDKAFITVFPRELLLLLSLTSIMPIFIIGIRWASYFGDPSRIGIFFTTFTFHIVHAVFFLACLWVAFDPPFSPRQKAYGLAMLPLYYLGALCIGYFAGYFLLIFGTRPPKTRNRPHPVVQFINFTVVACVWILAASVPVFQVWKNLPQLRAHQASDAAFAELTLLTARALPQQSAVVLSDDPLRLSLLQILSDRDPKLPKHLFLDASSLDKNPFYIRSLEKKYPQFPLAGTLTNAIRNSFAMIDFLDKLGKKYPLYYIHPSFGYYFEHFYAEPQGPVFQLKLYDTNTWIKPSLTSEQIEENQKFWKGISENQLPVLTNLISRRWNPVRSPVLQYFMDSCHLTWETNKTALLVGTHYAQALDYWGVELQKAKLLPEASNYFAEALELNPDSISARVNLQFNQVLQAGKKVVVETPTAVRDQFGKYRGWDDLLRTDGPFDDPSFRYVLGQTFVAGENYHEGAPILGGGRDYLQAVQEFNRVRVLAPDFTGAALWLCKLYLRLGVNTIVLTNAEAVLKQTPDNSEALFYKAVALMQMNSYDQALAPLNQLLTLDSTNYYAMLERGISYLQLNNYSAAKPDYETLFKVAPKAYQVDFGLQEIAYHEKNTNDLVKYLQLYLTNYYQSFRAYPTNFVPPETDEVKLIKQRLKESKNGAP